jgi:hypothetical protein
VLCPCPTHRSTRVTSSLSSHLDRAINRVRTSQDTRGYIGTLLPVLLAKPLRSVQAGTNETPGVRIAEPRGPATAPERNRQEDHKNIHPTMSLHTHNYPHGGAATQTVKWSPLYNGFIRTPAFNVHITFGDIRRIVLFRPLRLMPNFIAEFEHLLIMAFPVGRQPEVGKAVQTGYGLSFYSGALGKWSTVRVRGSSGPHSNAPFTRVITDVPEGSSIMLHWL